MPTLFALGGGRDRKGGSSGGSSGESTAGMVMVAARAVSPRDGTIVGAVVRVAMVIRDRVRSAVWWGV